MVVVLTLVASLYRITQYRLQPCCLWQVNQTRNTNKNDCGSLNRRNLFQICEMLIPNYSIYYVSPCWYMPVSLYYVNFSLQILGPSPAWDSHSNNKIPVLLLLVLACYQQSQLIITWVMIFIILWRVTKIFK